MNAKPTTRVIVMAPSGMSRIVSPLSSGGRDLAAGSGAVGAIGERGGRAGARCAGRRDARDGATDARVDSLHGEDAERRRPDLFSIGCVEGGGSGARGAGPFGVFGS